jgi:hypothetical protein
MKFEYAIREVDKFTAAALIQTYHYSKVMPKLTKHYLGIFLDNKMVGVLTLGWGTQPRQTINKLFPGFTTADYYEIGKMCMLPEMPRNSESQMISAVIAWMKVNTPQKKFLYTWADGIVGKVGYVYQAANFLYGGFIWTDIYIGPDGEKIHPRTTKDLCKENAIFSGKEKVFWLTKDFMKVKGISRIKGKQFRYIMPLNKISRRLLTKSTVEWTLEYPKQKDLQWKKQTDKGYELLDKAPDFDLSVVNVNKKNVNSYKQDSAYTLEQFLEKE